MILTITGRSRWVPPAWKEKEVILEFYWKSFHSMVMSFKEMLWCMVLSLTGGLLRAWTIPMRTANGPDGLEYGVRTSQHTLP